MLFYFLFACIVNALLFSSSSEAFVVRRQMRDASYGLARPSFITTVVTSTGLFMGNYAEVQGGEAFGYIDWSLKASSYDPHSDRRFQRALKMLGGEERFPCLTHQIRGDILGYSILSDVSAVALKEIKDFKKVGTIGRIPQLINFPEGKPPIRISEELVSSDNHGIRMGIELGLDSKLYDFVIREVEGGNVLFRSKKFEQEDISSYNKQVERNFAAKLHETEPAPGVVVRFRDLVNPSETVDLSGRAFMLGPFICAGVFEVDSSVMTASDFDRLLNPWVPPLKASVATGNPIEMW